SATTLTCGKASWARRCDFSLLSAIATTCDTPGRLKLRATFGPQYPYPITPTLIMNSPIDSLSKKWVFAEPIFWGGMLPADMEGEPCSRSMSRLSQITRRKHLIRTIAGEDGSGRAEQDFQVEQQRLLAGILQVQP